MFFFLGSHLKIVYSDFLLGADAVTARGSKLVSPMPLPSSRPCLSQHDQTLNTIIEKAQ